jgi:UDP-N-acetylmuramate dehydrogenase
LGGEAASGYFPQCLSQARAVYDSARESGKRLVIIGNGSNILADDGYFDGVAICTKKLKGIVKISDNCIFCLAGTTVGELLRYCIKHAIGGLEYLAGIPATVGGLAFMNGGAGGFYIGDNIISVKLYNGKNYNLSRQNCNFSYKYSTMRDINSLILGVFLQVAPCKPELITDRVNAFLSKRKHLPKGKSCGCVFKNVGNISAGKIIEDCGLKGARVGKAYVSDKHANFIINDGNSATDVIKLIEAIKKTVKDKENITLEEEVVYIRNF